MAIIKTLQDWERKVKTYIFDIDHTLIKSATGIYFVRAGLDRHYFSRRQLLKIPIILFKYRMGFLKGSIVEREIPFMKGLTVDILEELGRTGFECYGRRDVFDDARKMIAELQGRSENIVFATSSFDYSVRPVADYFGVKDVIASSFEFKNGTCTGYIEGRTAFGESKKNKVVHYLSEKGLSLEDCVFYSDSHHDIPLLESVGKAVAVNPDRKLRAVARENRWDIIRFR